MNDFLQNFAKQTTVHGLHIVGIPKLHLLERVFWLTVVALATFAAIEIAYSNWMRYLANPAVVSLQKDFRNWENPFPAVTGCFIDKTETTKAEKYILNKWNATPADPSFEKYMKFITTVSNSSYENLEEFSQFSDDTTLQNVDMLDIASQVHPKLSGTLVTFETKHKTDWQLVMSELGMCFSVNSLFVDLLAPNRKNAESSTSQKILKCHYLNGLCYARYDSDHQLPLKYYIHSYLEVVHATIDPPLIVHESEELEINYRMQETVSSASLRDLSPSQRKCRFSDEPITDELPIFSSSTCHMSCRYKLALKFCKCKPFFYHMFKGKVCDVKGLICLSKHANYITQSPSQIGCKCPQPCNLITYFPQAPKYTKWEYGYFEQRITFRWGLLPPTTKFRRDVLFGFEDLVVSFGGTLALFLGISFISAIETVFLLVESMFNFYAVRKQITKVKPVAAGTG